jgi:hypothetical protein
MALLFCDGMDVYTQLADLQAKGWVGAFDLSTTLPTAFSIAATGGAFGGGSIEVGSSIGTSAIYYPNLFTWVDGYTLNVGQYFKQVTLPADPAYASNASDQGGFLILSIDQDIQDDRDTWTILDINEAGNLVFCPFGGSTPNATTGHINLCDGVYHWVEVQIVLSKAVGSITVIIDGVTDLHLTNIPTIAAGSDYTPTGGVGFGMGNNSGPSTTGYYDDYIVWDNTGSHFNTFPLGQRRIYTATPNGAGASTQFAPSAGANYAVAAQSYSGNAKLTAGAAGLVDLYQTTGLDGANPSEIDAVVVNTYASNPANGLRELMSALQSKGTTVTTAAQQLTSTLVCYQYPSYTDSSGAAWTAATVSAMQIGMESA